MTSLSDDVWRLVARMLHHAAAHLAVRLPEPYCGHHFKSRRCRQGFCKEGRYGRESASICIAVSSLLPFSLSLFLFQILSLSPLSLPRSFSCFFLSLSRSLSSFSLSLTLSLSVSLHICLYFELLFTSLLTSENVVIWSESLPGQPRVCYVVWMLPHWCWAGLTDLSMSPCWLIYFQVFRRAVLALG